MDKIKTSKGNDNNIKKTNKVKNKHHPLDYPVVIKRHEGFLTLSLPDFHEFKVIELPKTGLNQKFMIDVSKAIGSLWLKTQSKINDFTDVNRKTPSPSLASKVLSSDKYRTLTAPQVAKILGKSVNTIRRMADRGEIPCFKSEGGKRFFLEKDIF